MNIEPLKPVIKDVLSSQGEIFAVGGAVRDKFLKLQSKDLDVLVTGIPYNKLLTILNRYGKVDEVGESFGIIKFTPSGSTDIIDVALPRTERSIGAGHKDFEVNFDHTLSVEADLIRRDFTINAIAVNLSTGEYIDPHGGQQHIKEKVICTVYKDSLKDDPLRILRAVQFSARFGFDLSSDVTREIIANREAIHLLSPERIAVELAKLFGKGKPIYIDDSLIDVWSQLFPEIWQQEFNQEPFSYLPEDMELRFLMLLGNACTATGLLSLGDMKNIVDRLKLSSGGFDTERMLRLYGAVVKTDPEELCQSDYSVRSLVSHQLNGSWKDFWDVCRLWSGINRTASALSLISLSERAARCQRDPLLRSDLEVAGYDVIQAGFTGKDVGDILKLALECVLLNPALNTEEVFNHAGIKKLYSYRDESIEELSRLMME